MSISRLAYVTLLEGDNEFILGVLALARSLRVCGCRHKLIVGTLPDVAEGARALLAAEPNVEIRAVPWLELPEKLLHGAHEVANPQFLHNFTKLRLWQWTDLSKIVYLDADTLVTQNIDDMFLAPALSAVLDNMAADEHFCPSKCQLPSFNMRAPCDDPARSYFNAGVLVLEPSAAEYECMLVKLAVHTCTRFAEQDFLNAHYTGRWNALPLTFNWGKPSFWLCPELCVFSAIKVIHFSGRLKPWHRAYDGCWRKEQVAKAPPAERNAVCGGEDEPADANLTRAVDFWWRALQAVSTAPAEPSTGVSTVLPTPLALSRAPSAAFGTAPPKVLFVVHRYFPFPGGSESYVHWLATEASERGWNVTVLASAHKGNQGTIRVTDDTGILTSEPFDSIIVHGADCCTQDECLSLLAEGKLASPATFLVIEPSESPAALSGLKNAALIGCSTKADWSHARAHGADETKLAQVTHGVDALSATGAPGFRKRHNIEQTSRLFVSAGGFGKHKRMLELSRAFERARSPRDVLCLFGYSPHPDGESYIEKCSAVSGVKVLVGKQRQEVVDALLEADLYIMHSEHEGFGLCLLESMLNGCPWAAYAGAGAASDLHRFGHIYSTDEELQGLITSARPLQPMRRAALRQATLSRYTVRATMDELHHALAQHDSSGAFLPVPPPLQPVDDPPLMPAEAMAARRACFATFLHGSASGYFLGAIALKRSLDSAGSMLPFIVAVTSTVPAKHRARMEAAGCELRPVHLLSIGKAACYGALRKEFVTCFTKLEIWKWTDYERIVYLDTDMIATRNLDHLAAVELPEEDVPVPIAAARDLGDASRRTGYSRVNAGRPYFNAGLMVIRPSIVAYEEMMRSVEKVPTLSLPYAEQDMLNDFVSVHLVELPVSYNCTTDKLGESTYEAEIDAACGIMSPPAVWHFCGPKPWRTLPPRADARDSLHADPRAAAFKTRSAEALHTWWTHGREAVDECESPEG